MMKRGAGNLLHAATKILFFCCLSSSFRVVLPSLFSIRPSTCTCGVKYRIFSSLLPNASRGPTVLSAIGWLAPQISGPEWSDFLLL